MREVKVGSETYRGLGREVAKARLDALQGGYERMTMYVNDLRCISFKEWDELAAVSREAMAKHCPRALEVWTGISEEFENGWRVMVDMELQSFDYLFRVKPQFDRLVNASAANSPKSDPACGSNEASGGSPKRARSASPSTKKVARDIGARGGCCTGGCMPGVVAQTVELPNEMYGFGDADAVVHCSMPGHAISFVCSDGRLMPIGHNRHIGVCLFTLFQLPQRLRPLSPGLPLTAVLWEMMLRCQNVQDAIDYLKTLPMLCGGSLMVTDRDTCANIEWNSLNFESYTTSSQVICRANHGLLKTTQENDANTAPFLKDSEARQEIAVQKATTCGSSGFFAILDGDTIVNPRVLSRVVVDFRVEAFFVEFKERYVCATKKRGRRAEGRILNGRPRVHRVARVLHKYPFGEAGGESVQKASPRSKSRRIDSESPSPRASQSGAKKESLP